ncbi:Tyrosine recombinase XerC [Aquamicrobium terrae]
MPRKQSRHITFTPAKGKRYYYFRVGKGPRIPLPGVPGSDEFEAAYAAALTGKVEAKAAAKSAYAPRTIAALITDYIDTPTFRGRRPNTRKGYLSRFEAIRVAHGHRSVAGMTSEGIEKAILLPYSDRPGAYLDTLKKLRILVKHAIKLKWLTVDPTLGIERPKNGEIRAWTEGEIEQFEQRWKVGTKQRLAFALMLYTGQRRSDVHRMTWTDINDGRIRVVQQKTGAKLHIRIHRELAKVLETTNRDHVTILNTAYGRPFTVDGFSGFMRDAIKDADLPLDAQPHGLRKTAGRRLAEAGATAHEIMAVLGHKTLAEAERYTREADQQHLADEGIGKVEARKRNKSSQTNLLKFGKKRK